MLDPFDPAPSIYLTSLMISVLEFLFSERTLVADDLISEIDNEGITKSLRTDLE